MKIIIGKEYLHHSLGLVRVGHLDNDGCPYVLVMTDRIIHNASGEWEDDWGQTYNTSMGDNWYVKPNTLKPVAKPSPKDKHRTPVQIRCKDLWNNSNWVKAHPEQAYT